MSGISTGAGVRTQPQIPNVRVSLACAEGQARPNEVTVVRVICQRCNTAEMGSVIAMKCAPQIPLSQKRTLHPGDGSSVRPWTPAAPQKLVQLLLRPALWWGSLAAGYSKSVDSTQDQAKAGQRQNS